MNVETGKKVIGVSLIIAMTLKFIDLINEIISQSKYTEMSFMTFIKFLYSIFVDLLPIFAIYVVVIGVEQLIKTVEKNNDISKESFNKLIRRGITANGDNLHINSDYNESMIEQALNNRDFSQTVPARKRCPECNTYCKSDAIFCSGCGKKLE